jgi:hypothetical protein
MSRAPRRHFLAPFVLTAAAALPGCKHGGDTNRPSTSHPFRSWDVWASGDDCEASDSDANACEPNAECNPPEPIVVACPEGMAGDQVVIVQDLDGGPCRIDGGDKVACPEELMVEDETPDEDAPDDDLPDD